MRLSGQPQTSLFFLRKDFARTKTQIKPSVKKTWFKVVLITSFYYSTLGIRKYASATSWKAQPLLNTRQYVSLTSRRCCSHLGTSCDDSLVYQVDQSQGAIWYVAATSRIGKFY